MDRKVITQKRIIFSTLSILMLLAAVSHVNAQQASHPANSMWVEPASIYLTPENASIGYKFNITIWLNISDIKFYSYSIGLLYNRTILKATKAGFTYNFTAGHDTASAGPIIDTSYLGNGSVLATESCKGEDYIQGPKIGTLIWIEFEVTKTPEEGQTLTSLLDITTCYPEDTWVMDYNLEYVELEGFNAFYQFVSEFNVLLISIATALITSLIVALKVKSKRKH